MELNCSISKCRINEIAQTLENELFIRTYLKLITDCLYFLKMEISMEEILLFCHMSHKRKNFNLYPDFKAFFCAGLLLYVFIKFKCVLLSEELTEGTLFQIKFELQVRIIKHVPKQLQWNVKPLPIPFSMLNVID